MKVRNGFVSNSSTTSFCIYGTIANEFESVKLPQGFDYYYSDPNNDSRIYIGKPWCDIGDDETGKQFKDNINKTLNELLGKEVACSTFEECYYDG